MDSLDRVLVTKITQDLTRALETPEGQMIDIIKDSLVNLDTLHRRRYRSRPRYTAGARVIDYRE